MAANEGTRQSLARRLGDVAPLISGNGRRAPDRRRVSLRWLSGSILTGFASLLLMGGALYAAFDGRHQLAEPPSTIDRLTQRIGLGEATKGDRPLSIVALEPSREKILQVPTMTRVGESNVIRKKPFAYAEAPLAIVPLRKVKYAGFNPLSVFSSSGSDDRKVASSDSIYSANIENEVTIKTADFPLDSAPYEEAQRISDAQAHAAVFTARASLEDGQVQTAALAYLDTTRFALKEEEVAPISSLGMTMVAENVTKVEKSDGDGNSPRPFAEEVLVIARNQPTLAALSAMGAEESSTNALAAALSAEIGSEELSPGMRLRVAWERAGPEGGARLRRVSAYQRGRHLASAVIDDGSRVVVAEAPVPIEATADTGEQEQIATIARSNLPNVYDGIHRAALSQGLTPEHAKRIVRTVAFDVDFRSQIGPKDALEVFYSMQEGEETASEESEILYIGLTLKGEKRRYYRFRSGPEGEVDYFDEDGKSAKKFLLRKTVPNGKFRSKFGMRWHPISRRKKMHWGVDFSAPRGTPIISAGNGVVEKAGWSGGYGRQVIIRHANGYKTSYSHMHRFAKGIRPGKRVRLGQIIGQVGSTGYSTGPHLHYEVIVNGRKVNPMGIRLPKGKVLKGRELAAFKRERRRIDALLERSRDTETTTLASL